MTGKLQEQAPIVNRKQQEEKILLSFISKPNSRILDVGCGLGRYLIPLTEQKHYVVGVDKSIEIVAKLRSNGYANVYSLQEAPEHLSCNFDYIIMSHIIEHIESDFLISFLDGYIRFLKIGGKLIISTPVMYSRFYDDYDHIKPYPYHAISGLYSDSEQFQEKPLYRLEPCGLWYRREPYQLSQYPETTPLTETFVKIINSVFKGIYLITNRWVAETTGWVGVFDRVV